MRTVRRILGSTLLAVVTALAIAVPAGAEDGARGTEVQTPGRGADVFVHFFSGGDPYFNPCTNEYVRWDYSRNVQLDFRQGDRSWLQRTGTGLTSGLRYEYVSRLEETSTHGSYDLVRITSQGPAADLVMIWYWASEPETPEITCT